MLSMIWPFSRPFELRSGSLRYRDAIDNVDRQVEAVD